ncbi:MAG: IS1634 family transposase [Verrucomicrobia bacterium]|nr:MAG: IS1634 family transposase [Verrucomicrobiota bacterium]
MFFRTKTVRGTPVLQLVESYRNPEGLPRQRVLASLGDASVPVDERGAIAKAVELRLRGEESLFPIGLSRVGAEWAARILKIAEQSKAVPLASGTTRLDGVMVERIRTDDVVGFGPHLVALKAWEVLRLSVILSELGMEPERIAIAQLMVVNRLVEPLSEWALIDWSNRTALPEMLGVRLAKTTKDRLYRTSDELLKIRRKIEKKLRCGERELFSLRRSIVLYDVTNTHFEGLCQSNPKAKHGKNKQKRNDCRQVAIGMAFDEHGFALAHEVFEGNIADTKTLLAMLDRLDLGDGGLKPVVILDAGFASEENIKLLEERGCSYLVNITRGSRTRYADYFENETFSPLPGRKAERQVEVKRIVDPENENRRLVLCRSAQRREKEQAMISTAEERFLVDGESLLQRIEKGRLKKPDVIERKIGAFMKKHPRVARFYKVEHKDQTLHLIRNNKKLDEALALCGDYVLKTDKTLDAETLWELYMTLLEAEKGFRMLKSTLGLRPNFHQLEKRVDGHIFISVLAYHLLRWIGYRLETAGDLREWRTLRRLLGTHVVATTRLPLEDGREVSIRKPSQPDAEQERVYALLGIDSKRAYPPRKTELKR